MLNYSKHKVFNCALFLVFFGLAFITMIQENKREKEQSSHHGKCTGVIRIGGEYETFILCVLQRSNGYL